LQIKKDKMNIQPKDTSRGHFYVSLAKSAIRVLAGIALINSNLMLAGALVIAAEALGVVEELV
jgi:predicted small integral membrane protein